MKQIKKKNNYFKKVTFLFIIFMIAFSFFSSESDFRKYLAKESLEKGNYYFNEGEYDLNKSRNFYKLALFFNPSVPLAHYQLGRIYFLDNKLKEARKEMDLELALHPNNKRSYYILGLIDGYSSDFEAAIEDFQKFISWAPDEWAGYNDLAWVYYKNENFQKSKEITLEGLEKFPNNIWLLNGLGVAELSLGEFSQSQETMEKVSVLTENVGIKDWSMAYPGNNPKEARYNLEMFKEKIAINLELAKNRIAVGGNFADACSSSTYYHCSGSSCVGYACDPDHEICSNSCSADIDCSGPVEGCTLGCNGYFCGNVCSGGFGPNSDIIWWVGSDCAVHGYPCSVPPPDPCGDGFCDINSEDCNSCPTDCGACPPSYSCTGSSVQNSYLCPGDSEGLSSNLSIATVAHNGCTSRKCEYECNEGTNFINGACLVPVRGVCGNAQGEMYCQKPTSTSEIKLCNSGDPIGIKSVGSYWEWTCQGRNGGDNSGTCKALKSCAYREVVPN